MGSVNRIEGPIHVNGDESHLLCRREARDAEEGWSVVERPYRSPELDELLRDASCTQLTCLLAGNRVRMADGGAKRIEHVRVGEYVATMSGAKRIEKTETTQLGMTRHVIELRGQRDQVLFLSDDHPLWVSRTDAHGTRKEWWGTYNVHHTLVEMTHGTGLEFRELPFILRLDLPEQVAHESGWLHVRPVFHHMQPDTRLYHLVVEDGFSFIAEGFPVFSHVRDGQGPQEPWRGLDHGMSMAEALTALVGGRS